MNGKLILPTKGGYLHTEDGYEHRGRNEDGPIDIKPKFKSWPTTIIKSSVRSKVKPAVGKQPTKPISNPSKGSTPTTTTKGTK